MTPKERVKASLRREKTDRVPIYMWLHPETADHLGELLGIASGQVSEALGDDVRQMWVNNNYPMGAIVHECDGAGHIDQWGIEWVWEGGFNQIARSPLEEKERDEVLDYRFPEDHVEELLAPMAATAAVAEDYFLGCDVSPCVFEMYWRLRGMEQTMLDMAEAPDFAETMFGYCADFAIRLSEFACARFPLDWLWTGDDVAGQFTMLMSPAQWRTLVKPHLARVAAVGTAHGLPVAYHCCGALRPIIPDLIEIGIAVLNPVQSNSPGMEPLELKREFGAHLAFMGGVDTQHLLPHGTADEVYAATARLIDGMTADGGGYLLAASHSIPPETPDDNIFAMYAAAGLSREEIFDRASDIRWRLQPDLEGS